MIHASRPVKRAAATFAAVAAMLGSLAVPQGAAQAANFVVNTTADTNDGSCNAANCTWREAIYAGNAAPGMDTITFNIPPGGPQTIRPLTPLPPITDPVIIDGTTQPGTTPDCTGRPIIELDGTLAPLARTDCESLRAAARSGAW